jgi:hypothetical protein
MTAWISRGAGLFLAGILNDCSKDVNMGKSAVFEVEGVPRKWPCGEIGRSDGFSGGEVGPVVWILQLLESGDGLVRRLLEKIPKFPLPLQAD